MPAGLHQSPLSRKRERGRGRGQGQASPAASPLPNPLPFAGEGSGRATAIARRLILAIGLAAFAGLATAAGGVAKPDIVVDPGKGSCIAPPAEMRRNHMEMLKHQRDKTLRAGERGAPVSLNGCIECHAGKESGSVTGSRKDFCESCHAYAAVKLDCFECHQPKAAKVAAGGKP